MKENSTNSIAIQQGFHQHNQSIKRILSCIELSHLNNFFEAFDIMAATASSMKMEAKEVKNVQLISNQACDPPKFKAILETHIK